MKKAIVGAVVLALYLAVAFFVRTPVRPLFDGSGPPQPYQWVSPPPDFAKSNEKPKPFAQTVAMTKNGISGASLQTDDGQAIVIVPERSFAAKPGARGIRFRIVPLASKSLTKQPPKQVQGNAYRITARYVPSQENAVAKDNFTVLLRYPAHATDFYRLDGDTWTLLKGEQIAASLQIYANTKKVGTFAAAGGGNSRKLLWYITGGVSLVAAILGLILGLRERRTGPARRRK